MSGEIKGSKMSTSNIRIKKICVWCGNEFEAQKSTTQYCSKRCAEHAYKDRKRQEKKQRVETHEVRRVETSKNDALKISNT